jgi:hypothetical protein
MTGDANAATAAPDAAAAALAADPERMLLACIGDHYAGTIMKGQRAQQLSLPDGTIVPWDDGKTKTTAQRIDAPDIEDMFALGYPTPGAAIVPVTDEESDPGRIRVEPLFRSTYGMTARDVSAALVDVKIAGKTVRFHKRGAAPALERVAARLDPILRADPTLARFFRELGGTFNPRNIAGTDRMSAHSWGIAIDIDTSLADYWRNAPDVKKVVWRNRIPQTIVDAFEAEGFVWGGRWFHYDTMHFEYRPELFDARCRAVSTKDDVRDAGTHAGTHTHPASR